jgi:DNA adenine methylase
MILLPKDITRIVVPPIKCQGIKTKLVPFIAKSIEWDGNGRWVEPFLGSGVVAFNINAPIALLADSNKHIIHFYKKLQSGKIDSLKVREFLFEQGKLLEKKGETFYYEVRERFNETGDSLDFLFLNRSCFNGLMRFNSKGGFNVPFGHKPKRFAKSYITKIVNQVENVSYVIRNNDWTFCISDWQKTLDAVLPGDFVYLDPPYIGRHTDYFNQWSEKEAISLSNHAKKLPAEYALSMWLENKYRKNDHIDRYWEGNKMELFAHFYHLGSLETLRNKMTEALVMRGARIAAL